ncbi:hypothetical protein [Streptomyces fradiae]|uniref:hypothetical protein n=1 Tax=Streptomyces fradiae TaxID=1906 RepID=UPI00364C2EF5
MSPNTVTELAAEVRLSRYYGAQFVPLLARHTGITVTTLQRYLHNEVGFLSADR